MGRRNGQRDLHVLTVTIFEPAPSSETPPVAGGAPLRVIIVQSVTKDAQNLAAYFNRRRDEIWQTTQPAEALSLINRQKPDLVILDLHLPGSEWLPLLRHLRPEFPATRVIVTNKYPDLSGEALAKEQGVQIFLRQPLGRQWVDRALERLSSSANPDESLLPPARAGKAAVEGLPRVRFPVGLKIALPYVILALVVAAGAAYLMSRYVLDTLQGRFTNQLVDVGTLSVDGMVQEDKVRRRPSTNFYYYVYSSTQFYVHVDVVISCCVEFILRN